MSFNYLSVVLDFIFYKLQLLNLIDSFVMLYLFIFVEQVGGPLGNSPISDFIIRESHLICLETYIFYWPGIWF